MSPSPSPTLPMHVPTRVAGYCNLGWYRSDGIWLERAGRPGGDRCGWWSWLFQLFTSGGQEDGAQALGEFGLGGDQCGEPVELAALGEFLFGVDDGLQRGLVGVQGTLPGGAGGRDGPLVELADLFHAGLDRTFGLRGGGLDRISGLRGGGLDRISGLRGDRVGGFQEGGGVLRGLLVGGAHSGFSLASMWGLGWCAAVTVPL